MVKDVQSGDAKEQIQKWLMEDGWSLRQESGKEAVWAFVGEDRLGRKVVVGQNIGREDEVILQGTVRFDEATTDRIAQLREDERNDFLWDLRFELLRTDLEFAGVEAPLKEIRVTERIFFDALTKDTFLQRVAEVRKGVLAVIWMVNRRFAQPPPPKQLGFQK